MKTYKRMIKNSILKLPFGKSLLLPFVFYIYACLNNPSFFFYRLKKKSIEKKESEYILNALRTNKFNEIVIVYDLKVSPPTYGDFMYVVMIARVFLIMGKKVIFFVINSEFREDTLKAYTDSKEREDLIIRLLELPQVLLNSENCDLQVVSWTTFNKVFDKYRKALHTLILFKEKVIERQPIYIHCYNLCNLLIPFMNDEQTKKFLICKDEIVAKIKVEFPQKPYITWACRYSMKWGFERNNNEREFLDIYKSLRKKYPDKQIMIVSDETGCTYFKEISQKNNLTCLFSKDFSDTFMGDCALVIGSDCYFQLNGGGIGLAAIYSTIPYHIIGVPVHETVWKKNHIAVWANINQIWKTATEVSSGDF